MQANAMDWSSFEKTTTIVRCTWVIGAAISSYLTKRVHDELQFTAQRIHDCEEGLKIALEEEQDIRGQNESNKREWEKLGNDLDEEGIKLQNNMRRIYFSGQEDDEQRKWYKHISRLKNEKIEIGRRTDAIKNAKENYPDLIARFHKEEKFLKAARILCPLCMLVYGLLLWRELK